VYHPLVLSIGTRRTPTSPLFPYTTPFRSYSTQGLRTTLTEVFARIAGDLNVPAIHRLETAFGGGKTHTLIACTHIAFRGRQLQQDRKSTRLNSSHVKNSYAVFCLKKKKKY